MSAGILGALVAGLAVAAYVFGAAVVQRIKTWRATR